MRKKLEKIPVIIIYTFYVAVTFVRIKENTTVIK